MNSLLKLKNVTKRFSSVTLFDNVNIDIYQKGLYGLIGASGSGKSTLLLMIGLIDEEYEGDIFFKNINYKEIKNKEEYIFNHIGFVFQNPVLFSDLTLYENLSLTNDVDDKKINELLLKMGLLAKKKTLAKNLSGGERVRLSIIRSLLNNPDILILDEPTSALDEYNSSLIMSFLKEEANNRAILIVSHNVKLLEKNVQYLYVLKNRKIELISNKQNRTFEHPAK